MEQATLYFDVSGNAGSVGTAEDWAAFGDWVDGLDVDGNEQLVHFWEQGWEDDLLGLERQLSDAETNSPSDGGAASVIGSLKEAIADRASDDGAVAVGTGDAGIVNLWQSLANCGGPGSGVPGPCASGVGHGRGGDKGSNVAKPVHGSRAKAVAAAYAAAQAAHEAASQARQDMFDAVKADAVDASDKADGHASSMVKHINSTSSMSDSAHAATAKHGNAFAEMEAAVTDHPHGGTAAERYQSFKEIERAAKSFQKLNDKLKPGEGDERLNAADIHENKGQVQSVIDSAKAGRASLKEYAQHRKEMQAIKGREELVGNSTAGMLDANYDEDLGFAGNWYPVINVNPEWRNVLVTNREVHLGWQDVENCGGKGGTKGPCPKEKVAKVPTVRKAAASKASAKKSVKPPEAVETTAKTTAKTTDVNPQAAVDKVLAHLKKTGADIKHFSSDDLMDEVGLTKSDAVRVLAEMKGSKGPQSDTTAKAVAALKAGKDAPEENKPEVGNHVHTTASIKAALGAAKTVTSKVEAIKKLMDDTAKDGGQVYKHGMTKPESVKTVVVNGLKVSWPDGHGDSKDSAARLLYDLTMSPPVSKSLMDVTNHAVFTGQSNAADAHWEKTFGMANFKSGATGGDGSVVYYDGGRNSGGRSTFVHEAGHNLANKLWGSSTPPATSDFGKAQTQSAGVTAYGRVHAAEDFAETVKLASGSKNDQAFLQKLHPAKWAAIKPLLGIKGK